MSKTKTACCYTPAFPYQRHFDGYVEISEEDAALFWGVNFDPAPDHQSNNTSPILSARATQTVEEINPERVMSIGSVPTSEPDDPRRVDVSAALVDASQDTKPVEPARAISGREQTGASADNTLTPRPLCFQSTIGTQANELHQPRVETSLEDETPITPTETTIPGPTQPEGLRTKRK